MSPEGVSVHFYFCAFFYLYFAWIHTISIKWKFCDFRLSVAVAGWRGFVRLCGISKLLQKEFRVWPSNRCLSLDGTVRCGRSSLVLAHKGITHSVRARARSLSISPARWRPNCMQCAGAKELRVNACVPVCMRYVRAREIEIERKLETESVVYARCTHSPTVAQLLLCCRCPGRDSPSAW